MDDQIEDLKQAILKALIRIMPDAEISFDPHPGFGKLHSVVVWAGFQDMPFLDRQHFAWNALRAALTDEQRLVTGFLLLASPSESSAIQEHAVAA